MATIIQQLVDRALATPDRVAFTYLSDGERLEEHLTYSDLMRRAGGIANVLRERGMANRPVAILLPQGLSFIVAFYGCLYAGSIAVPAAIPGKNRGIERWKSIVDNAGSPAVLSSRDVFEQLWRWFGHQPFMQQLDWIFVEDITAELPHGIAPANPAAVAFLQYTSGSTGAPKGVMVTHGNILANSEIIRQCFQNNQQSTSVCWLPSFHDMGLLDGIVQPVYAGFRAVLMSPLHFLQKPVRWLNALSTYGATYSGGPNFAFDHCVNRIKDDEIGGLDLRSLRCLYNGAEPIRAATLQRFGAKFERIGFKSEKLFTCYGLAEATLAVTASELGKPPRINRRTEPERVSCGRTWVDTEVQIRHPETLALCSEGQEGEIWVGGTSIAVGYWQQPETSTATFPTVERARFLRTGDLGYLDGGELFVTGRLKDLIIINGTNHYPQDIELTVEQSHPDLQSNGGAAFSVERDGRERLIVVQELTRTALNQRDHRPIIDAILAQVATRHELAPAEIVLVPPGTVPRTSSGKVQRRTCRQQYLHQELTIICR